MEILLTDEEREEIIESLDAGASKGAYIAKAQAKKIIEYIEKHSEIFDDGDSKAICIPIKCWEEIKKGL